MHVGEWPTEQVRNPSCYCCACRQLKTCASAPHDRVGYAALRSAVQMMCPSPRPSSAELADASQSTCVSGVAVFHLDFGSTQLAGRRVPSSTSSAGGYPRLTRSALLTRRRAGCSTLAMSPAATGSNAQTIEPDGRFHRPQGCVTEPGPPAD